jgi:hypothetical protein
MALVVHLPGVTRGTSKTEVVVALVAVLHEPYWQCIWVAQRGLLGQVMVVIQVLVGAEKLGCARLLQGHEEIVGQQVRALRGGVEPHAVGGLPTLHQVPYVRELVAELILLDRGSPTLKLPAVTLKAIKPGVRTDVSELVHPGDDSDDNEDQC